MINFARVKISNLDHLFNFHYFAMAGALFCFADIMSAIFYQIPITEIDINNIKIIFLIKFAALWFFSVLVIWMAKDFIVDSFLTKTLMRKFSDPSKIVSISEIDQLAFSFDSQLLKNEFLRREARFQKIEKARAAILMILAYFVAAQFYKNHTIIGQIIADYGYGILVFAALLLWQLYVITAGSSLIYKDELEQMKPQLRSTNK